MLTKEGCLARQKRLWDAVPSDVEWLLIADPRHVLYLSNFLVQPLSFSGGERCLLLLERGHGSTLIGDNFTIRSASATPFVDHEVIEKWYDHQHAVVNRDHAKYTLPSHDPSVRSASMAVLSLNLPSRFGAEEPRATTTDRTNSLPSFTVGALLPPGFR